MRHNTNMEYTTRVPLRRNFRATQSLLQHARSRITPRESWSELKNMPLQWGEAFLDYASSAISSKEATAIKHDMPLFRRAKNLRAEILCIRRQDFCFSDA